MSLSQEQQSASRQQVKSNDAPYFSVILCTYNRRNFVLSALASLRRQTLPYQQFEVIVVDNGSTDGTFTAVQNYVHASTVYPREPEDTWHVQCLFEPRNGLAHARNKALQAASGKIAVFLDDDTIADPHFLERLLTAYSETDADAISGRVELRLEGTRPHWLHDNLLPLLGYFAPTQTRTRLQEPLNLSSSSFSVRLEALRAVGGFSPFLSKRLHAPTSMEIDDLCHRLRQAGYSLWYEPEGVVIHRVPAARLQRPYFTGRAYWQGRSEMLMQYANTHIQARGLEEITQYTMRVILFTVLRDLREVLRILLLHRPLQVLAGASTNERLLLTMDQARKWGHLQQRIRFLEHIPLEIDTPAVLLVHAAEPDTTVTLLTQAFHEQHIRCTISDSDIPLTWLWQHRSHDKQSIGIIHIYRPGAFHLTHRQRQRFWFLLRLARHWGIRIVSTDTGGWWQNIRTTRYQARRAFERKVFQHSHLICAYTHQPGQLYPEKNLRRCVQCLTHPGFRGYYPPALPRIHAKQQLGLPEASGCIYVCFANQHTERELLHLLQAFTEVGTGEVRAGIGGMLLHANKQQHTAMLSHKPNHQLLLVGVPKDVSSPTQLLKQAALNSAVHLFMEDASEADLPLYMGAAHAVVMPHFFQQNAGVLETAIVALSYERFVIAPSLPRFRGMLPPYMSTLYDPESRTSLIKAMEKVQARDYHLKEYEARALDAQSSWNHYAHHLLQLYKHILGL